MKFLYLGRLSHDPTAAEFLCVYCWPAASRASWWDEHGLPCCRECIEQLDRKCKVPKFVANDLRRQVRTKAA